MEALLSALDAAVKRVGAAKELTDSVPAVQQLVAAVTALHEAVLSSPTTQFSPDLSRDIAMKLFVAFAVKSETPRVAVLKVLPSLLPALEDPSTCFRKFTKVALSHLNLNTLKLIKKTCLQLYDAYMRLFAALCAVSAQEVLRLALKDGPSGFDDLLHTFAQLSLAPLPRDTLVSALTAVSHLLAEEATLEELAPGKTAALKRCLVASGFDPAAVAALVTDASSAARQLPPRPSAAPAGDSLDPWRGLGPAGAATTAQASVDHVTSAALRMLASAAATRRAAMPPAVLEALRMAGPHTFVGCKLAIAAVPTVLAEAETAALEALPRATVTQFSATGLAIGGGGGGNPSLKLSWAQLSVAISDDEHSVAFTDVTGKLGAFTITFPSATAYKAVEGLLGGLLAPSATAGTSAAAVSPEAIAAVDVLVQYSKAAAAGEDGSVPAAGAPQPAAAAAASAEIDTEATLVVEPELPPTQTETQTQAAAASTTGDATASASSSSGPLQAEALHLSQLPVAPLKPKCSKSAPIMAAPRATRADLPDFSSKYLPGHSSASGGGAGEEEEATADEGSSRSSSPAPEPAPAPAPAPVAAKKGRGAQSVPAAGAKARKASPAPGTGATGKGRKTAALAPPASAPAAPPAGGRPRRAAAQAAAAALAAQAAAVAAYKAADAAGSDSEGTLVTEAETVEAVASPAAASARLSAHAAGTSAAKPWPTASTAAASSAGVPSSVGKAALPSLVKAPVMTAAGGSGTTTAAAAAVTTKTVSKLAVVAGSVSPTGSAGSGSFDWDAMDDDGGGAGGPAPAPAAVPYSSAAAVWPQSKQVTTSMAGSASFAVPATFKAAPAKASGTRGKAAGAAAPAAATRKAAAAPPAITTTAATSRGGAKATAAATGTTFVAVPAVWGSAGVKRGRAESAPVATADEEGSGSDGSDEEEEAAAPFSRAAAAFGSKSSSSHKPAKLMRLSPSSEEEDAPFPPSTKGKGSRSTVAGSTAKNLSLALLGAASNSAASEASAASEDSQTSSAASSPAIAAALFGASPASSSSSAAPALPASPSSTRDPIVALRQFTAAFALEAARLCPESKEVGAALLASAEDQIAAFHAAVVAKLAAVSAASAKKLETALGDLVARTGSGKAGVNSATQALATAQAAFKMRSAALEAQLRGVQAALATARATVTTLHAAFRNDVHRFEKELEAYQEDWTAKVAAEKAAAIADLDGALAGLGGGSGRKGRASLGGGLAVK